MLLIKVIKGINKNKNNFNKLLKKAIKYINQNNKFFLMITIKFNNK